MNEPLPRLGILASGSGSNFQAVAEAVQNQILKAEIPLLITNNPKAGAIQRAEQLGIRTVIHDHRDFASREALDRQISQTLQAECVDWVIMAGWMRLVTQVLIDAYPDRILNIHPSLLPSFPGIRAVEQALAYGVKISGCTVHRVTLAVDSGPIVMQAAVPVLPNDTPEMLHQRIQGEEHRILIESIALCLES